VVETVASSTSFDLPVDEIITQAAEGIGGDPLTGNELKRARTALNLILISLQNRGMAPLSSLSLVSVALVSGSSLSYPLGSDVFNVMNVAVRTSTASGEYSDTGIEVLGYTDWLQIVNKQQEGRPTQYMVDRTRNNININVWPVPNATGRWSLQAWTVKRIADINASYQLVGLPHRYLPAVVAGLRYQLAVMRKLPLDEREWFRNLYETELQLALDEDREKKDFNLYPEVPSPV
jgi:hypothetical protein